MCHVIKLLTVVSKYGCLVYWYVVSVFWPEIYYEATWRSRYIVIGCVHLVHDSGQFSGPQPLTSGRYISTTTQVSEITPNKYNWSNTLFTVKCQRCIRKALSVDQIKKEKMNLLEGFQQSNFCFDSICLGIYLNPCLNRR